MSYKEELAKRSAAKSKAKTQQTQQREATVSKMASRATELVKHIQAQARDFGLVIKQQQARILINHSNTHNVIRIDADVDKFLVATDAPPSKAKPMWEPLKGSTKTLRTYDEIDAYIVNFLEQYEG